MYRGETKILNVIGSAGFIQEYVPVGEANHAVIKIIDHRLAIFLSECPCGISFCIEVFGTSFREEKILFGKCFMYLSKVLVHLVPTAPTLVPVKADAPRVFRCLGIAEIGAGPLINKITIMIPHDDLLASQPF